MSEIKSNVKKNKKLNENRLKDANIDKENVNKLPKIPLKKDAFKRRRILSDKNELPSSKIQIVEFEDSGLNDQILSGNLSAGPIKLPVSKLSVIKPVVDDSRGCVKLEHWEKEQTPNSILFSRAYRKHFMKYLFLREQELCFETLYLQGAITSNSRSVVVNWLLKVGCDWKLGSVSFLNAIRMFDTMLLTPISLDDIQGIGLTALWISNKVTNDGIASCMETTELVELCDDAYTKQQFLVWEWKILKQCAFSVDFPDHSTFVNYYIYELKLDKSTSVSHCAQYLIDCLSLEDCFSTIAPSLIAASAVLTAAEILEVAIEWSSIKERVGFYKESELRKYCKALRKVLSCVQDPAHETREPFIKYSHRRYNNIAATILMKTVCS